MSMIYGGNSVTFPDGTTQNTAPSGMGFKNRIINGAMGIWQRGTSGFTTQNNYSADRWKISTGGTITTGAQSSDVPAGFKYSLSMAGNLYIAADQRIESVNCTDLPGQSITVSFWVKQTSGAASGSLYAQLFYANSTDNFSGITLIGSATFTGSGTWTKYSTTFTNLPANSANGIEIFIGSNAVGSAALLVTGVQLEVGITATSFDYRPYGTELALCQRYYQYIGKTSSGNDVFASGFTTGTSFYGIGFLKTTMRSAPTLSYTGSISDLTWTYPGTLFTVTGISGSTTNPDSYFINLNSATAATSGWAAYARVTTSSTALTFSSEL